MQQEHSVAGAPHILIVEDHPNTAEMLTAYFTGQGYQVTAVGWGREGVRLAEEIGPDLIVLDIRLPDIDGYEVCRSLRIRRRTQQIPVIFLTERRGRESRLKGLELGAVDYLTKPFDIQELHLRVRNVLHRAGLQHLSHPTTGLPAQALSDERLGSLLGAPSWAVVSVGLRGLKHFAEAYGFVARDDVVRAVALMLNHIAEETGDTAAFVGHLDDENMFIDIAPQYAEVVQRAVTVRLNEAKSYFYPSTDWEAKRTATGMEWPQLEIATGVLQSSQGTFESLEDLKRAITDAQATAQA